MGRLTNCSFCGKELTKKQQKYNLFCSNTCSNQARRQKKLDDWLSSGKLPYGNNTMIKVKSIYREYIDNEQNHKCAICGIPDIWNGKHLVFVLDHIDGNASNHSRDNLRLVCPNCDSQLPTFKSRNKKSTRTYKKEH